MNILKFIKELFSSNDIPEPQSRNRHDEEECFSYYVPPINDEKMMNNDSQFDSTSEDYSLERTYAHNVVNQVSDVDDLTQFEFTTHGDNETISDELSDTSNCETLLTNDNKQEMSTNIEVIGEDICELIHEFDSYYNQAESNDAKQAIEVMQYRLIETLCKNGITPIENETSFDPLKHISVPFAIIPDGTPIKKIKRIGLLLGNKVLLKAQVII